MAGARRSLATQPARRQISKARIVIRAKMANKIALSMQLHPQRTCERNRHLLAKGPNDKHGIKRKCERCEAGQEEAKT